MKFDVLIVGAGPVGLLLANLLGESGVNTLIIEKKKEFSHHSRAIGISPPSLGILKQLGLDRTFISSGVKMKGVYVHGSFFPIGRLNFEDFDSNYRFILSLPQKQTIEILLENLKKYDCIDFRKGVEITALSDTGHSCEASLFSSFIEKTFHVHCSILVGCDGARSTVRNLSGMKTFHQRYKVSFLMADFEDQTDFGNVAHLFFTYKGAVESFPLPFQKRRWILQTQQAIKNPPFEFLENQIRNRTEYALHHCNKENETFFEPYKMTVEKYYSGRIVLCGDSCHVMSPIGGQGMNIGFADSEYLSQILVKIIRECKPPEELFRGYHYFRKKAFHAAAQKVAEGMWIGTRTGVPSSLSRDLFLFLLMRKPFSNWLSSQVSMLANPYYDFSQIPTLYV